MIVTLNKNYYGVWYLNPHPIELLLSDYQFKRFKKAVKCMVSDVKVPLCIEINNKDTYMYREGEYDIKGYLYESYSGMIYSNLEGSLKSYNEMKTHIALHAYHFTLKDGRVVMFWKV